VKADGGEFESLGHSFGRRRGPASKAGLSGGLEKRPGKDEEKLEGGSSWKGKKKENRLKERGVDLDGKATDRGGGGNGMKGGE